MPRSAGWPLRRSEKLAPSTHPGTQALLGGDAVEAELAGWDPATGLVAGTVVDTSGRPVAGAKIEYSDSFGRAAAVSDERGAFRLEALPDGSVRLSAKADDFATW